MWLDEVVLRAIEVCVPLWSHIKTRLSLLSRHTLIWTCTRSSYDVDSQSSCPWMDWWTLLFWVSSLIALCILFLRANFTSNTRWESQTFHHDENSPGFRRVFKVIWIRVKYISRLFKQNYIYYTVLCSNMTSHKKKWRCHRKCGNVFKVFWGRSDRYTVTQLKKSL